MIRKSDGKIFAMKEVKDVYKNEKTLMINEASLIAFLDSEEMIKCVDLYDFRGQVFIILQFMDQGSMTDIILNSK